MRIGGQFQDLTYWAPTGSDRYGNKGYAAPIALKGRWEDKNEEFVAPGGATITSAAVALVDRDLLVQGYLAEGNLTAVADPTLTDAAWEIRAFIAGRDLRNVTPVRKAVM
jgi:hypothetical protein